MSGCALRRWGGPVGCGGAAAPFRPTEASKAMEEKLALMRQEREKQDQMWLGAAPAKKEEEKK